MENCSDYGKRGLSGVNVRRGRIVGRSSCSPLTQDQLQAKFADTMVTEGPVDLHVASLYPAHHCDGPMIEALLAAGHVARFDGGNP
jgi:hypothetical protein